MKIEELKNAADFAKSKGLSFHVMPEEVLALIQAIEVMREGLYAYSKLAPVFNPSDDCFPLDEEVDLGERARVALTAADRILEEGK